MTLMMVKNFIEMHMIIKIEHVFIYDSKYDCEIVNTIICEDFIKLLKKNLKNEKLSTI